MAESSIAVHLHGGLFRRPSSARMNLPASTEGNWRWRFRQEALKSGVKERLKWLTELYVRGRNQSKVVAPE